MKTNTACRYVEKFHSVITDEMAGNPGNHNGKYRFPLKVDGVE
jgi:hypothetical protein